MATTNSTVGTGIPAIGGLNEHFVLDSGNVSIVGAAANDIFQCINVPAGVVITHCYLKIVTACDVGSSDADLGVTGDDANGFDDGIALDAAAATITQSTTSDAYTAAGGKYFAAADTIDLITTTMASTPTTGTVRVWAVGYRLPGIV